MTPEGSHGEISDNMAGEEELNPYAAPITEGALATAAPGHDSLILAERGTRLGAHIIDGLIALLGALPGMVMVFWAAYEHTSHEGPLFGGAILGAVGLLVVASYQWYLVATTGQTLGKRYLRVKILMADGREAGFVHGVVLRSWVTGAMAAIPYLGSCVGLVDALMIFNTDRRCLHDRIAGTVVVQV